MSSSVPEDPLLAIAQQARMDLHQLNDNLEVPASCPLPVGEMELEAPAPSPYETFCTVVGLTEADVILLNKLLSAPVKEDEPAIVTFYRTALGRLAAYLTTDLSADEFQLAREAATALFDEVRVFCTIGVPGLRINSFFKNPALLVSLLPNVFPPAQADGFVTVPRNPKGRKRQNSNSSVSSADAIPVSNKFAVLGVDQPEPVESSSQSAPKVAAPKAATPAVKKPPPIFVDYQDKWTDFTATLQCITPDGFNARMSGEYIAIYAKTIGDYRAIQEYISSNNIKHQALPPKEERPLKVLIRGLPPTLELQELRIELEARGFTVITVGQKKIKGKRTDQFYVNFSPKTNLEKVFEISYLFYMRVQISRFRSDGSNLCYNCQRFGHHSSTCNLSPRCLKCGESHETRSCTKPKELPAKCCNCGGPHPASHRGCPANPLNKAPVARNAATKKSAPAAFIPAQKPTSGERSFASIAAASRSPQPARGALNSAGGMPRESSPAQSQPTTDARAVC